MPPSFRDQPLTPTKEPLLLVEGLDLDELVSELRILLARHGRQPEFVSGTVHSRQLVSHLFQSLHVLRLAAFVTLPFCLVDE